MREFTQAGVELIGVDAPEGTAEVVEVLCAALDAAGLPDSRIALGDADLYRQLLVQVGVEEEAGLAVLQALERHDFVEIESVAAGLEGVADDARELLVALPRLRGGSDVLEEARRMGGEAVERATTRLQATFDAVDARGVGDRVILDLGLLRELGYYTGAILEVYDPALGHIVGGGGRYDNLIGRFGRSLPAAGFALYLERLHVAQAEEERLR
jgi:ATP phosphoribosyltransferase regulatory subunit